jgi:hypothetical protein
MRSFSIRRRTSRDPFRVSTRSHSRRPTSRFFLTDPFAGNRNTDNPFTTSFSRFGLLPPRF